MRRSNQVYWRTSSTSTGLLRALTWAPRALVLFGFALALTSVITGFASPLALLIFVPMALLVI